MTLVFREPLEGEVTLNPDQMACATRDISSTITGLRHLLDVLGKGEVSRDLIRNVLFVASSSIADLGKTAGVPTESENEMRQRFEQLRNANLRIHELELQLGQQVTASHVKQALGVLTTKVRHWWREHGLGYISEIEFHEHGVQLKLSGMLSELSSSISNTPVSDNERYALRNKGLESQGFELAQGRCGSDMIVVDSPASREALQKVILAALPSAKIMEIRSVAENGYFKLRDIRVHVRDFGDIEALPMPEQAE